MISASVACTGSAQPGPILTQLGVGEELRGPSLSAELLDVGSSEIGTVLVFSCAPADEPAKPQWRIPSLWSHGQPG